MLGSSPIADCERPVASPTALRGPRRQSPRPARRKLASLILTTSPGETFMGTLDGKTVAILAADELSTTELLEPRKALDAAGARTRVVLACEGRSAGLEAFRQGRQGQSGRSARGGERRRVRCTAAAGRRGEDPDQLRLQPKAIAFIRAFIDTGKPIAAICHGPWTLIDADGVDDAR